MVRKECLLKYDVIKDIATHSEQTYQLNNLTKEPQVNTFPWESLYFLLKLKVIDVIYLLLFSKRSAQVAFMGQAYKS